MTCREKWEVAVERHYCREYDPEHLGHDSMLCLESPDEFGDQIHRGVVLVVEEEASTTEYNFL